MIDVDVQSLLCGRPILASYIGYRALSISAGLGSGML